MEQPKTKAARKKILLMGRSGSGKSSMRSIIFSNFVAKDVRRLGATIDVEHTQFKFLGNLILNLWDCGGQDAFTETYLTSQKPHVFSDVGVLIYVFDCESRQFKDQNSTADFETYFDIISALAQFSPNAHVFCLIHKMDLVAVDSRDPFLDDRAAVIERYSGHFKEEVKCYGTSIWDQSLYAAWGDIVQSLTPNLRQMDAYLRKLLEATQAEEVILFERATFLKVTNVTTQEGDRNPYPDRFEKLSTFVKSFKHSLQNYTGAGSRPQPARDWSGSYESREQDAEGSGVSKGVKGWASHPFGEFSISCPRFNLLLGRLTSNAYILVVSPPTETGLAHVRLNVMSIRDELERLENPG